MFLVHLSFVLNGKDNTCVFITNVKGKMKRSCKVSKKGNCQENPGKVLKRGLNVKSQVVVTHRSVFKFNASFFSLDLIILPFLSGINQAI